MKIKKSSWHYKFNILMSRKLNRQFFCNSSCEYFVNTVTHILCLLPYVLYKTLFTNIPKTPKIYLNPRYIAQFLGFDFFEKPFLFFVVIPFVIFLFLFYSMIPMSFIMANLIALYLSFVYGFDTILSIINLDNSFLFSSACLLWILIFIFALVFASIYLHYLFNKYDSLLYNYRQSIKNKTCSSVEFVDN